MDGPIPIEQILEKLDHLRGDLLRVEWVDIAEDPLGNPAVASLARRTSYGLFWGFQESHEVPCLVTTTTVDHDVSGQNGYVIYPLGCVRGVEVIKRTRRPRAVRKKVPAAVAGATPRS